MQQPIDIDQVRASYFFNLSASSGVAEVLNCILNSKRQESSNVVRHRRGSERQAACVRNVAPPSCLSGGYRSAAAGDHSLPPSPRAVTDVLRSAPVSMAASRRVIPRRRHTTAAGNASLLHAARWPLVCFLCPRLLSSSTSSTEREANRQIEECVDDEQQRWIL